MLGRLGHLKVGLSLSMVLCALLVLWPQELTYAQPAAGREATRTQLFSQLQDTLAGTYLTLEQLRRLRQAGDSEERRGGIRRLRDQYRELQTLNASLQGSLAEQATRIKALRGSVPEERLAMGDRMRAAFSGEMRTVLTRVRDALRTSEAAQIQAAQQQILRLLPQPRPRRVGRTPEAMGRTQVYAEAGPAGPPQAAERTPPTAAALQATIDVQLTPEIRQLARDLRNDPARIFLHVRNRIEFEPYYGSAKGSQLTFLAQAGNDIDQASLLIALLRAASIPARYARGTIELHLQDVAKWVKVKNHEAAFRVLVQSGIPATRLAPNRVRLPHVWVEAWLTVDDDYDRPRPRWVRLAPAFKAHRFKRGLDLERATGFDRNRFLQGAQQGAIINESQAFFTGLNEAFIDQELQRMAQNLQRRVRPTDTLRDVVGGWIIIPLRDLDDDDLDEAFPFRTAVTQARFAKVPDTLRFKLRFRMPGINITLRMPEVATSRLGLFYQPATEADRLLIEASGGIEGVFPAASVNMRPHLMLGDTVRAVGKPAPLGTGQPLQIDFVDALGEVRSISPGAQVGAWHTVTPDMGRMPPALAAQRAEVLRRLAEGAGSLDLLRLEAVHNLSVGYWMVGDLLFDLQAAVAKVTWTHPLSLSTALQELQVVFVDGLPGSVRVGGVSFGVHVDIFQQASFTHNLDDERAWRLAALALGSAEEHGIFEQLLNVPAVSTVRLLQVANAQRVPILAIDRTNVDRQMARLDTFCEDFIRRDAEAGFTVVVPERNIQFEEWFGIAWIRADPRTGVSNYFICGGIPFAGGGSADPVVIEFQRMTKASCRITVSQETARRLVPDAVLRTLEIGIVVTVAGIIALLRGQLRIGLVGVAGGLFLVTVSLTSHREIQNLTREVMARCPDP